jgi:hypothetical protein
MSALYVQTRTLWVPILCHVGNNLVALSCMLFLPDYDKGWTIQEFHDWVWFGALVVAVGVGWAVWHTRSMLGSGRWQLPKVK